MTNALVLSSGAQFAGYQVGVLKRLMYDLERDYQILCGTSAGALNSFILAHTPYGKPKEAWKELWYVWNNLTTDKIIKDWFPFGRLSVFWKKSLYDSNPLRNLIKEYFDYKSIKSSNKKISIGAVSLDNGEKFFATEENENLDEWALASASCPIFMPSVSINNQLWIDGGIKIVVPIAQALKYSNVKEIDVILCDSYYKNLNHPEKESIFYVITRCIELMFEKIAMSDIKIATLRAENFNFLDKCEQKKIKVRIIKPSINLPNKGILKFCKDDIKKMIEIGYADAKNLEKDILVM